MERASDFQKHGGSFISLPPPGGKWWRWMYQKKCEKIVEVLILGFGLIYSGKGDRNPYKMYIYGKGIEKGIHGGSFMSLPPPGGKWRLKM